MVTKSPTDNLARQITLQASKQTYYTMRLLADGDRVQQGLQAYAYFRWVDDRLDLECSSRKGRNAFLGRQQIILNSLLNKQIVSDLVPEESMLADLLAIDPTPDSGLKIYLRNLMQVMAFDAERRGRLISQVELDNYTHHLAVGVTELLHYLIGHDAFSPRDGSRYAAASAAHIVHMLRDTYEDVEAGYFNIPREVLAAEGISPRDIQHPAYRSWVRERILLADFQFHSARNYLSQVESLRCRLAGYTYMNRFEVTSALIKKDEYLLRPRYPRRRTLDGVTTFLSSLIGSLMRGSGQTVPIPIPVIEPKKNK